MSKSKRQPKQAPFSAVTRLKPVPFFGAILAILMLLGGILGFRAWQSAQTLENGAPFSKLPALKSEFSMGTFDLKKPVVDLSAFQAHTAIDYDKLSGAISGAIVRVQHGTKQTASATITSAGVDTQYKYHMTQLQSRGIPVAAYAYVDGKSTADMIAQAKAFYENAKAYQPTFYWIDAEAVSMTNLNAGLLAYKNELVKLGVPATKIGLYSYAAFISENKLITGNFSAIWVASYGLTDDGTYTAATGLSYPFVLQQYTAKGTLSGYSGALDLDRLSSQAAYNQIFLGK
ncbi:MAG: glycosyl hydrolase family 25 [Streptococcaceae bacterium]|jgi:lysozyme|nr:glycosyl hydrolase family 25 [Streptococcaceae bacterium]